MNKKLWLAVVFSVICLNSVSIFGQEKLLEKKEFDSIIKKAQDNLIGKTYRLTRLSETFDDRNELPKSTIKIINESIAPDKSRYFYEYKTSFRNHKFETIKIGQKRYKKMNDDEWEEEPDSENVVVVTGKKVESETYKFIGRNTLDNQSVSVYEQKKNLSQNLNGNLNKETVTTTYWISDNGLLIKTQIEEETETAAGKKGYTRSVGIYEYNLKDLKIEAPIK